MKMNFFVEINVNLIGNLKNTLAKLNWYSYNDNRY